jgi:hypothetical protein
MTEGEHIVVVPFNTLQKDVPLECTKYIRNYAVNPSSGRSGTYTEWATKITKQHTRAVRRLHRAYGTGISMRYIRNRRAQTNRTASKLAFDDVNGSTSRGDHKGDGWARATMSSRVSRSKFYAF